MSIVVDSYLLRLNVDFTKQTLSGNVVAGLSQPKEGLRWTDTSLSIHSPHHDITGAQLQNSSASITRRSSGDTSFVDLTFLEMGQGGDEAPPGNVTLSYTFTAREGESTPSPYFLTSPNKFLIFLCSENPNDVAWLFPHIPFDAVFSPTALFSIELNIPADMTAVSNAAVTSEQQQQIPEGSPEAAAQKVVVFEPTPEIPITQLGIIVGKMQSMRSPPTKSGIQLRALVPEGCDLAHTRTALDVLQKSLDFMEESFETKLQPLAKKIDLVAVPLDSIPGLGHWGLVPQPEESVLVKESTSLLTRQKLTLRLARDTARHWFGAMCRGRTLNDLRHMDGFARYVEFAYVDSAYSPKWNIWTLFTLKNLEPLRRGSKRVDHWMVALLRMFAEFATAKTLMAAMNEFVAKGCRLGPEGGGLSIDDFWNLLEEKSEAKISYSKLAHDLRDVSSHPFFYVRQASNSGYEITQLDSPNYRRGFAYRCPPNLTARASYPGVFSPFSPPLQPTGGTPTHTPTHTPRNVGGGEGSSLSNTLSNTEPGQAVFIDPVEDGRGLDFSNQVFAVKNFPMKLVEVRKGESTVSQTISVNVAMQFCAPVLADQSRPTYFLNENYSGLFRVDYSNQLYDSIFEIRTSLKAVERVGLAVDLGALRLYHVGKQRNDAANDDRDRCTIFLRYLKKMYEEERHCVVWQATSLEIYALLCLTQEAACCEALRMFLQRIYKASYIPSPKFEENDTSIFDYNPQKVLPNLVLAGILRNLAMCQDVDVGVDAEKYVEQTLEMFVLETVTEREERWDHDLFGVAIGVALSSFSLDPDKEVRLYHSIYSLFAELAPNTPSFDEGLPEQFFVPASVKFKHEVLSRLLMCRTKLRRSCLSGLLCAIDPILIDKTVRLLRSPAVTMSDVEAVSEGLVQNPRLLASLLGSLPVPLLRKDHSILHAIFAHDDKINSPIVIAALRTRADLLVSPIYRDTLETILMQAQWVEYASPHILAFVKDSGLLPQYTVSNLMTSHSLNTYRSSLLAGSST